VQWNRKSCRGVVIVGKQDRSRQTLNAIHVVLLVAVVILLGLITYNYYESGRFSFTSFIIAMLILVIISTQRVFLRGR
jgi:hypothetical protein